MSILRKLIVCAGVSAFFWLGLQGLASAELHEAKTQDSSKTKLIVFVHGYLGSQETWSKFVKLVREDESLRDFEVHVMDYPASVGPKNRSIRQIGELLRTRLIERFSGYKEVYLIGHSMGGLVICSMVIEQLKAGRAKDLKQIKHIILFGTPNNGKQLPKVFRFFDKQLDDLSFEEKVVNEIRTEWINRVYSPKITPGDENSKIHIPVTVVIGLEDDIVDEESARSYFRDPPPVTVLGDHKSMKEPDSRETDSYRIVWNRLLTSEKPTKSVSTLAQRQDMRQKLAGKEERKPQKYRPPLSPNRPSHVQTEISHTDIQSNAIDPVPAHKKNTSEKPVSDVGVVISQYSEGSNSPNIAGDQNIVIITPPTPTFEIPESEFSALFTYERASLTPLGRVCDIGYLPSSEKVAYFYLEGIKKAHPEAYTEETNRPGMDLYGDIAVGLVFDSLFGVFSNTWDLKISKPGLPFLGQRIHGYDANSANPDFIAWSDLSVLFPNSYALKSPVQTPLFFSGKLAVPMGTKLSGQEKRDSNGGFSQTRIILENDFVDLEMAITLRGGSASIGIYRLVTTMPNDNDQVAKVWTANYDIFMKAKLKANRRGDPDLPKYHAWVNNMFETVREQLDSKMEWDRTKEALSTLKTLSWKPWKNCPSNVPSLPKK
jgi:pimeloyl-ACP methyl ester carboxylesterase